MSATIAIQTLLADMPIGQIFTTRELIGIASRASIDQCLYRLVKGGDITRLARGVFANGNKVPPHITPLDLAQIKAGAFHKEIFEHSSTTAQRLGYEPKSKERHTLTFATNGTGSTSFASVFGTIHLKAASPRKRNDDKSEVWELLKSLWHLRKGGSNHKIESQIRKCWGQKSQQQLQVYASSVPQWVVDTLPANDEAAFKTIYLNLIPHASAELDSRYHKTSDCEKLIQDMSPACVDFEPPEHEPDQAELEEWDELLRSSKNQCYCWETDECICPMFTCAYCQSQPILNRFSIAAIA